LSVENNYMVQLEARKQCQAASNDNVPRHHGRWLFVTQCPAITDQRTCARPSIIDEHNHSIFQHLVDKF